MSSANVAVLALLWAVVIWRLPAAWQASAWKRAPWISFLALAIALTADLPRVITWIDHQAGVTDLAVLIKHLSVVVGCTAVLDWVTSLRRGTDSGGYLGRRHIAAAGVAITLTALWLVMPRHETTQFTETETGPVAAFYLWVFYGYLGAALTTAAVLFRRARREARSAPRRPGLDAGLILLATGSALAAAYAASQIALLAYRTAGPHGQRATNHVQDVAGGLENVAIVLILIGTCVPAIAAGWQSVSEFGDLRALRPLWRDLVTATPSVAAGPVPAKRAFSRTFRNVHVRLIRRVGEIRDSALQLSRYVPGSVVDAARARLARRGLEGEALDAAAEACWLRLAVRAASDGAQPAAGGRHVLPGGTNLEEETALLRAIAAAYSSAAVQEVAQEMSEAGPALAIPRPSQTLDSVREGAAS